MCVSVFVPSRVPQDAADVVARVRAGEVTEGDVEAALRQLVARSGEAEAPVVEKCDAQVGRLSLPCSGLHSPSCCSWRIHHHCRLFFSGR